MLDIIGERIDTKVNKALLTKAKDWEYEAEWRLISLKADKPNTGPGKHILPPKAVDAVILGARISDEREARLRAAISAQSHITLLRARLHPTDFGIEIVGA